MTNNKLIYIEDDQILGNLITQALAENGFEVDFIKWASRQFGFPAAGFADIGY